MTGYFHVTLLAYTGLRDPVWRISKYSNPEISNLLLHAKSTTDFVYPHKCIPPKTGYKGFLVQESEGEQLIVGATTIQLQLLLLDTMPCELPPTGHYREKIKEVIISGKVFADCPDTEIALGEICTYNASSAPAYNPHRWNADDIIRRKNNCYNYALDQTTNTYAQPGKESGQIYSEISDESIRDAAVRDGWVVLNPHAAINNPVSTASDGDEHLVALFVAPGKQWTKITSKR